jgi:uncharacterized protein
LTSAAVPVVDSHAHLLPGRIAVKIRGFFERAGVPEMAYPLDHGVVRERHAASGITHLWTLPYSHKAGIAEGLNEASAETVAASAGGPVHVIGGAAAHPDDPDPLAVVRHAVEDLGLRVLKLHHSVGRFTADDPRLDAVWAYVSDVRLPVVVHAGHGTGGLTEAHELIPIGVVAGRYPDARIIVAHCGHRAVHETLDLIERHPNVHADLTPVLNEPVDLPADRAARLSDRLLFGTDAPNVCFTAADGFQRLQSLGLEPSAYAAITGGNAMRLVADVRS